MSDLISRADAIEAVAQQWLFEASVGNPYVNDDDIGEYRKLAEELFEDVPSAEAVQGEWEHWGSPFSDESEVIDTIVCSVCGARFIKPKDEPKGEYNYCPNCGARMKGGAE